MVDIFDVHQGKRLFAFVGIGGTLGALAGGWAANLISNLTESPYLPAGLMLIGAGCFCLAVAVMLTLDRMATRSDASAHGSSPDGSSATGAPRRSPVRTGMVPWSRPGKHGPGAGAARSAAPSGTGSGRS